MPPRRNSTASRKRKSVPEPIPEETECDRVRYFDKDSISEHLYCSICAEVFSYPIALQCGHVFCEGCIRQWLRPPQKTCPECRQVVDLRFSHRDLIAHKFLDCVPVHCAFLGCNWIGRMDALKAHSSDCECNPRSLPRWMVTKSQTSAPLEDPLPSEGTTSLRMRLFKHGKADLLNSAASGSGPNIFTMSAAASASSTPPIEESLGDLTRGIVTSHDVITRNRVEQNSNNISIIDITDDDESADNP
jgi:hypothetical protein